MTFTLTGRKVYENGVLWCNLNGLAKDLPLKLALLNSVAQMQAEAVTDESAILALQAEVKDLLEDIYTREDAIAGCVDEIAALKAEIARLTAPPVVVPPVTSPPIATGETVSSLVAARERLLEGKAVKLAPGTYTGTLDLRNVKDGHMDAVGVTLLGNAVMGNTLGMTLDGLISRTDGGPAITTGTGSGDIVLRGGDAYGTHKNPNSASYSNGNLIDADHNGGVGNILIEEYRLEDGRNAITGNFAGDVIIRNNRFAFNADDCIKAVFLNTDSRKEFDDNEMLWPFLGNPDFHCDAIQLRSISDAPMKGLKIRRNVMLCNPSMSRQNFQLIGNFRDATAQGHLCIDPEITDNIGASSTWHGCTLTRVQGGIIARNTFVGLPGGNASNPPTPWIEATFGATGVDCRDNVANSIGIPGTGNIATGRMDPAKYRSIFPKWDGSTPFTGAADARAKLAR